jgi:hypothetical protein
MIFATADRQPERSLLLRTVSLRADEHPTSRYLNAIAAITYKIASSTSPDTGIGTGTKQQCMSCGKECSLKCGKCKDFYFCDKTRQKAAWPQHKKVCATDELEKVVVRAVWLVQTLFMFARQYANTKDIYAVRWKGNRPFINFKHAAGAFLRTALPPEAKEQDRMMALAAGQCKGSVVFMSDTLQTLLKVSVMPVQQASLSTLLTIHRLSCHNRRGGHSTQRAQEVGAPL